MEIPCYLFFLLILFPWNVQSVLTLPCFGVLRMLGFGCMGYDFEGYSNTKELAKKHGYRYEEHKVDTEDDYILILHRLTGRRGGPALNKSAPVVLLLHGVLGSSTNFILDGTNSPAGILSDHGFDVWIGNNRGNRYSNKHESLRHEQSEFWRFTYNELALYDCPAMLDYILDYTEKPSVHFIGYSQAGFIMPMLLAYKPEYESKVKSLSFVAAALHYEPMKSKLFDMDHFLKSLVPFSNNPLVMWNAFEFMPYSLENVKLQHSYCNRNSALFHRCFDLYQSAAGPDDDISVKARFPIYMSQSANGVSSSILFHFAQFYSNQKVALFDYGIEKNMRVYGQATTPQLNFSRIEAPKLFIYGGEDYIVTKESVLASLPMVRNVKKAIEVEKFNHFNFLYSYYLKEKVYDVIADFIKTYD